RADIRFRQARIAKDRIGAIDQARRIVQLARSEIVANENLGWWAVSLEEAPVGAVRGRLPRHAEGHQAAEDDHGNEDSVHDGGWAPSHLPCPADAGRPHIAYLPRAGFRHLT